MQQLLQVPLRPELAGTRQSVDHKPKAQNHRYHADIVPIQQDLWQLRIVSAIVARKAVSTSISNLG